MLLVLNIIEWAIELKFSILLTNVGTPILNYEIYWLPNLVFNAQTSVLTRVCIEYDFRFKLNLF